MNRLLVTLTALCLTLAAMAQTAAQTATQPGDTVRFAPFEGSDLFIVKNPVGEVQDGPDYGILYRDINLLFPVAGLPEGGIDDVSNRILGKTVLMWREGVDHMKTIACDSVWDAVCVDIMDVTRAPEGYDPEKAPDNVMRGGYSANAKVIANTPQICTVEVTESVMPFGAAHPSYSIGYVTFSPERGRYYKLADFVDISKPSAKKQLQKQLFEALVASSTDEWTNEKDARELLLSFIPDGEIPITENIGVTPDGIIFRYQPYEVGPYSIGAPELFIPYANLPK